MFLLSPLGGALADRYPRRRVLLSVQTAMGVAAALLWSAWLADLRDPWLLLALMALIGALNGLSMPSWQGFVHDLVPREALTSAVTFNSLQFNAARAIGPAIAGLLLATVGVAWAFGINALSFGCVIVAIALVRVGRGRGGAEAGSGVIRPFVAAARYVTTQPGIMLAFTIAVIVGFLGNPVFAFTVVFAGAVFEVSPLQLGIMNAALGVGAFIAAPAVAGGRWAPSRGRMAGIGLIAYALGLALFGLAPGYVVGVIALVVIGACFLAVIASTNTSTQMIVADQFRGRVLAIRLMLFTLAAPIGSLAWGAMSDLAGPRTTVLVSALLMGAVASALLAQRGRFRLQRLDDPHDVGASDSSP